VRRQIYHVVRMKVVRVEIPGVQRTRYRWIVRKRDDGRYIVRAPKIGVAVKDLSLLRESDWGKETLLPIGSKILSRQTRRK
jgi:hypothetical protein